MKSIVVFSHLRWGFVHQRPQHLLCRLARDWRILFVEEPVFEAGDPWAELDTPFHNVTVLRPHTPVVAPGFHDSQIKILQELVGGIIERERFGDYGVWLYTPMAVPLLKSLKPQVIVYDCMDELTAFKDAPRQLLQREEALMRMANVVFAGGPSLFDARRNRHGNIHLFPSSVDGSHFGRAQDASIAHPEVAALPHPRLGFFGVVDERFDVELLRGIAELRPDWQFCIVGPVVKIDPAMLPRAANIHYYGQQQYEALPSFLAGWDVCLLPFARNESTRFISPTKTLEYMAAGLPIVSTSIADVKRLYEAVVRFGDSAAEFVDACEAALNESPAERELRRQRMSAVIADTSWDRTADGMRALINRASTTGLNEAARILLAEGPSPAPRASRSVPVVGASCVIVGAGPTGLSAAYHFGEDSVLLERNATVGGWCRSIQDKGFTFDFAGHIMFSNDAHVQELYKLLLGDNVHWQDREAWIYSKNVYTRYPFQGSLYGLPPEVLKDCIVGAIEARFGPVSKAGRDVATSKDCCADGAAGIDVDGAAAETAVGRPSACLSPPRTSRNFEEFIYQTWGRGIAKHFAIPYNQKLWATPLTEMETSWLGGRVPLPDLEEMIEGALSPSPKPFGPNARFGYPLRGGFQALMDGFRPLLRGSLELEADVASVSPLERTVSLRDGRRFRYGALISTMPLPKLVSAMGNEAPPEIVEAAKQLRHVSVRCVNLGIGRENITDKHWIYYPEDTVFHRIFVQGNASPHCNPPGGFGITCEITYSPEKPLPAEGDALTRLCIDDCIRVGLISASDPILTSNQVDLPYAYVVYDHHRARSVALIRNWLQQFDIVLAGRYSEWEYYNSDHAFLAGRKAADIAQGIVTRQLAAKSA